MRVPLALTLLLTSGCIYRSGPDPGDVQRQQFEKIEILAWNIESGGSEVNTIMSQLNSIPEFDILALSEVAAKDVPHWKSRFANEHVFFGKKGGNDRLMLMCSEAFRVVREVELLEWKGEELAPGGHRAPILLHLDDLLGHEFIVVNNHLARGDDAIRTRQAQLLVDWAQSQTVPVIAVGDYNFDYDFASGKGNAAFDAMLEESVFTWIRPELLIDTNWADHDGDGFDDYPGSMLDFTFTANLEQGWTVTSSVVTWEGDFPDDETTSDHRPVLTVVVP